VFIVSVVVADVLPAEAFTGFREHVVPVSVVGTVQAKLTSRGRADPAGFVVRSSFTIAGVPPMICTVPGESWATEKSTIVTVWLPDVPPPVLVLGFFGFVTVTFTFPGVVNCAAGMVIVREDPSADAVPPENGVAPKFKIVELFSPVPTIVTGVAGEPAAIPSAGPTEVSVGTALSIFVRSEDDLSFALESLGSATVAVFVTVGKAGGATATVSVTVLLPPPASGPGFVQVTVWPAALQVQPAPAPETKVIPAGSESVIVIVPVVAAVPLFVTLSV
jgi:hypothetical protein